MTYRPGHIVPVSGIYAEVTAFGSTTGQQVTAVKGEPFPPTSAKGYGYKLAQATRH